MRYVPKIFIKTITILFLLVLASGMAGDAAFAKKVAPVKNPPAPNPGRTNLNFEVYNKFSGSQEINLQGIEAKRQIISQGVLSPDMTKIAYSEVYLYPQNKQTSSKLFYFNVNSEILEDLHKTLSTHELADVFSLKKPDNPGQVILGSGIENMDSQIFRTLTIIDWSNDSKKLLVKEIVGENYRGIWATNIWVYDFDIKRARRLDEARKAITYYYKKKYGLYLNDYRWDMVPRGWDLTNDEMIIVNAYGYNSEGKEFLGCWGIDYKGKRTQLLSLSKEDWPVGQFGLVLAPKNPLRN